MNFLDADIIRITEKVTTLDGVIYHWKEKSRKLCKVQKRKSDPKEKGKNAIGVQTKAEGHRSETSTAKTNTHTYSQIRLANKALPFKGTSKVYQLLANSVQGKNMESKWGRGDPATYEICTVKDPFSAKKHLNWNGWFYQNLQLS